MGTNRTADGSLSTVIVLRAASQPLLPKKAGYRLPIKSWPGVYTAFKALNIRVLLIDVPPQLTLAGTVPAALPTRSSAYLLRVSAILTLPRAAAKELATRPTTNVKLKPSIMLNLMLETNDKICSFDSELAERERENDTNARQSTDVLNISWSW